MSPDDENRRSPVYGRFRATMHIGMGAVYLVLAAVVVYYSYFGMIPLSPGSSYAISGLMLLYGAFRIYRGIAGMRQR